LLWLESNKLESFEKSNAYGALVASPIQSLQGSINDYRIFGGDLKKSELWRRLAYRTEHMAAPAVSGTASPGGSAAPPAGETVPEREVPMPPLGTEVGYDPALKAVKEWILSLPPPATTSTAPAGTSTASPSATGIRPAPSATR
jgi:hypothetical protein